MRPSDNSTIDLTTFVCPFKVRRHFPMFGFHIFIVLSQEQDAIFPSDNLSIDSRKSCMSF